MRGRIQRQSALLLVLLLLVSTHSLLFVPAGSETESSNLQPEWVRFDVKEDVYFDAVGVFDDSLQDEQRDAMAVGPFGTFDVNGLTLARPVPASLLEPRFDLLLVLVSNEARLQDVRHELDLIEGLAVRELVAPSGLLLQGTPAALESAETHAAVLTSHAVPLGMLLDSSLLDLVLLVEGEAALQANLLRLDGWRDDNGPLDEVNLLDGYGGRLVQSLEDVARQAMDDPRKWDEGRYEGRLLDLPLEQVLMQPAVMHLRADPAFAAFNDQSRNHMQTNAMATYFTTDLDGSGQIVAVADAGLDEDHGDFGTRVVGSYDVIGDGSTADKHSGHGTHVSCTVLGDGFRGGYGGVAQAAELYFQAMENDNTGNFQSPSLNNLLNTAYNAGARTHTNSWGSSAASQQAKYNSETEDVDDRANYYDRYYNGAQGLTILFAAGNDGPNAGTVSPPATAKNVVSVGNHKNRYSGSPDVMMSGSGSHRHGRRFMVQHLLPRIHGHLDGHAQRRRCCADDSRIPGGDCSASFTPRCAGEGPAGLGRPGHRVEGHPEQRRGMGSGQPPQHVGAGQRSGHLGRRPFRHVRNRQQQDLFVQRQSSLWLVQGRSHVVRRARLSLLHRPTGE